MKISVAQIKPIKGNILANIDTHQRLIALASSFAVDAIFFSELSITGYEPTLAKDLSTTPDDAQFDNFQHLSDTSKITIGLGMPTKANSGIHISMIIFQPGKPRQTYSKQKVHSDELPYFVNGEKQIILSVNNKKIATAICYESLQCEHSDNAAELGAEIYVASVAKNQNGIEKALIHYPEVAKKHSMPVLMANCVGYCDNFESVGKSAVWTKEGLLAGQLDDNTEGILIYDTENEEVVKKIL